MSSLDEEMYKEKYLKYKTKYFELKEIEEQLGGRIPGMNSEYRNGIYVIFVGTHEEQEVSRLLDSGKVGNLKEIINILGDKAYKVLDGSLTNGKIIKLIKKQQPVNSLQSNKPQQPNKPHMGSRTSNESSGYPDLLSSNIKKDKVFDRCNVEHIMLTKKLLSGYDFNPTRVLIIKIVSSKVYLLNITDISDVSDEEHSIRQPSYENENEYEDEVEYIPERFTQRVSRAYEVGREIASDPDMQRIGRQGREMSNRAMAKLKSKKPQLADAARRAVQVGKKVKNIKRLPLTRLL